MSFQPHIHLEETMEPRLLAEMVCLASALGIVILLVALVPGSTIIKALSAIQLIPLRLELRSVRDSADDAMQIRF